MKKIIIMFLSVLFFGISSNSFAQLFEENFDYPIGDSLTQHGWIRVTNNGGTLDNAVYVVSPSLECNGFPGSNIGGSASLSWVGQDLYKRFNYVQDTGSVYVSFMVRVDTARRADHFLGIGDSAESHLGWRGMVWTRNTIEGTGKFAFGLTFQDENTSYTGYTYDLHTTYFMVLKYEFVPGGIHNDKVSLWIFDCENGIPTIEPTNPTLGPIQRSDKRDLIDAGCLMLFQGGQVGQNYQPDLLIDGFGAEITWNNTVLPVELSAFTSSVSENNVSLAWSTNYEINNSAFEIERRSGQFAEWNNVGTVQGNGNSGTRKDYSFTDRNLATGRYEYRLKQIDYNGEFEYYNLQNEVVIGAPDKFNLSQNYPNPFNPGTKISYDVPSSGIVSLNVYDMSGKLVAMLVNETQQRGYYTVSFDASSLSTGAYYYKLTFDGNGNNFVATKKMLLIK